MGFADVGFNSNFLDPESFADRPLTGYTAGQQAAQNAGVSPSGAGSAADSLAKPAGTGLAAEDKATLAAGGIKAASKVISSLVALNQSNQDREQRTEAFNANLSLKRKALMLDYLMGNRSYREKIKLIKMALSQSLGRRSDRQGRAANLATARRR